MVVLNGREVNKRSASYVFRSRGKSSGSTTDQQQSTLLSTTIDNRASHVSAYLSRVLVVVDSVYFKITVEYIYRDQASIATFT